MSEIKDKIKAWQVKLQALSITYKVNPRRIEYILKSKFEQLDWRTLLTDEMIEFADKELLMKQIKIKHKGEDKYEAQKKYFATEKGRRKVMEAVDRNRRKNAARKSGNK